MSVISPRESVQVRAIRFLKWQSHPTVELRKFNINPIIAAMFLLWFQVIVAAVSALYLSLSVVNQSMIACIFAVSGNGTFAIIAKIKMFIRKNTTNDKSYSKSKTVNRYANS